MNLIYFRKFLYLINTKVKTYKNFENTKRKEKYTVMIKLLKNSLKDDDVFAQLLASTCYCQFLKQYKSNKGCRAS